MKNKNKKISKDDLQKYLDNISINGKDLIIQNLIFGSFDDQKQILDSIEQFIREYKVPKVDKSTEKMETKTERCPHFTRMLVRVPNTTLTKDVCADCGKED